MYLYNLEVCEEDAFLRWREDVTDAYPGKGEALFQVCKSVSLAFRYVQSSNNSSPECVCAAGEHVADVATAARVGGRGGGGLAAGGCRRPPPAPRCARTAFISRSSHYINIIKPNS